MRPALLRYRFVTILARRGGVGEIVAGVFIALEGGEGAGKSTQAALLADHLSKTLPVTVTREPGATPLGRYLRSLLLGHATEVTDIPPKAEALLYLADRAAHVEQVIKPALSRGAVVICDRYDTSTLAYQGAGRGLGQLRLALLSAWAASEVVPDLTIVLDIEPVIGLGRRRAASELDRLETEEIDFHLRVRAAFRRIALTRPQHAKRTYALVDADRPADVVAADIRELVAPLVAARLEVQDTISTTDTGDAGGGRPRAVEEAAAR